MVYSKLGCIVRPATDNLSLQGYDYSGPWVSWTDNQANVYGGQRINVSSDAAIKYYVAHGATPSKITLGELSQ